MANWRSENLPQLDKSWVLNALLWIKLMTGCSLNVFLCFRTSKYGRTNAADDSTQRDGATRAPGMEPDDLWGVLQSIGSDSCSHASVTEGILASFFRAMEVGWDHHWMPWLVLGCLAWTCEWCLHNVIHTHTHSVNVNYIATLKGKLQTSLIFHYGRCSQQFPFCSF